MLVGRRHDKGTKKQHEDKEIVHAEGLLDQIARQKLQSWLWPSPEVQTSIKQERKHNPDRAPAQSLFQGNGVGFAMEHAQVKRQHYKHKSIKRYPEPDRR